MVNEKVPVIIYDELVYTNQIYARGVSAIPKSFFLKHAALNQRQA
jgi:ATP-dependent RNA helicase DHX33